MRTQDRVGRSLGAVLRQMEYLRCAKDVMRCGVLQWIMLEVAPAMSVTFKMKKYNGILLPLLHHQIVGLGLILSRSVDAESDIRLQIFSRTKGKDYIDQKMIIGGISKKENPVKVVTIMVAGAGCGGWKEKQMFHPGCEAIGGEELSYSYRVYHHPVFHEKWLLQSIRQRKSEDYQYYEKGKHHITKARRRRVQRRMV